MKLRVEKSELKSVSGDVFVVPVFEGEEGMSGIAHEVNQAIGGGISRLLAEGEITGKLNETAVLYPSNFATRKVVVVGLGSKDKLTREKLRRAAGSAIKAAAKGKVKGICLPLLAREVDALSVELLAQTVVEGALLASYRYDQLKSKPAPVSLEEITITVFADEDLEATKSGVERGRIMAEGTMLARDLVNAPGNYMNPTHMAEAAQKIAAETGLECDILETADMEKLGMGSLLGVAQGSAQPPKLIVLRHKGTSEDTLAIVGKGLTFDSGGISLKPGDGMHLMKNDMSGGAAVLGAMQAIGRIKPAQSVLGIVAASENMPSGNALKPGDVITAMNGKTIEVLNTDAEGRLILADAVAYAHSLGAKRIVDIATLTGACGVALGPNIYSAIVANDDALVADIKAAAELTGERYWQMPGDDDYKELIKSQVADLQNTGGRLGGVMTGGLFIGEFAGDTPWAHLDIAPTSFTDKDVHYQVKGGTGVAVRTLVELACK